MRARHKYHQNKIIILIITAVLIFGLVNMPVSAEGGVRIWASSSSRTVGQTFSITISPNPANVVVSNYEVTVKFNPDLVSVESNTQSQPFEGDLTGAGTSGANIPTPGEIIVVGAGGSTSIAEDLARINFKANKVGNATFSIVYAEVNADPAPESGPVTVTISAPLSSNNNLSSLSVSPGTLSPAFASGTTSYSMSVAMNVSSITVDARPQDSNATVSPVSGHTDLKYGSNDVKVTVTAHNGATKTYTIKVNRAAPTPTPSPTTNPEETTTADETTTIEETTEETTPEPSPTPSPTPVPPVEIESPDGSMYIVSDLPEGFEVPEGFYRTVINVDGQPLIAFKSLRGELILLYLTDGDGQSALKVYDERSQQIYDHIVITIPSFTYTFLKPEPDMEVPEGLIRTTLLLDGETLEGWRQDPQIYRSADEDVFILYLIDQMGSKGFFAYNSRTGSMTPYPYTDIAAVETETSVTTEPTDQVEEDEPEKDPFSWLPVVIALSVLSLILLGVIIWLIIRNRNQDNGPYDDDPFDETYEDDDHDDRDDYSDGPGSGSEPPHIPPVKRVN